MRRARKVDRNPARDDNEAIRVLRRMRERGYRVEFTAMGANFKNAAGEIRIVIRPGHRTMDEFHDLVLGVFGS